MRGITLGPCTFDKSGALRSKTASMPDCVLVKASIPTKLRKVKEPEEADEREVRDAMSRSTSKT